LKSSANQYPTFVDDNISIDVDEIVARLKQDLPETEFRNSYLLSEVLSKYPRPGISAKVREDAAIAKMLESEDVCRSINTDGYRTRTPRDFFAQVMLYASRTVADVLGDFNYDDFEKATFSAGATVSRKRKFGDPFYKYHSKWPVSVTSGCYNYAQALIEATPLWFSNGGTENVSIVAGNSITTVPKKTEIDRCIAKEPCLNMALQRAIGGHIRKRLKKFGINLNDQGLNQRLAGLGSRTGACATIDLKSASDSISDRLVWDLVPNHWYEELDKLRSKKGTLPNGREIIWEKFSSMGNGFTFELESLLFYALTKAVVKTNEEDDVLVSVYGDDIIVPTKSAQNLIAVLYDCGFSTNVEKTFIDGPFRESCGKHYYNGIDVTPFYIRKPIDSVSRVTWFLNTLRKWATLGDMVDPRVYDIWKYYKREYVPTFLWGGNSFENHGALVSPGKARKTLKPKVKQKRLSGWRALLRVFQYGNPEQEQLFSHPFLRDAPDFLSWEEIQVEEIAMSSKACITSQIPKLYSVEPNSDALWWASPPSFPQEVEYLECPVEAINSCMEVRYNERLYGVKKLTTGIRSKEWYDQAEKAWADLYFWWPKKK